MALYDTGDGLRLSAAFTDDNGDAADPTAVIFKLQDPDGEITTYTYGTDDEVVRDGVGAYHIDIDIEVAGAYRYRWAGTGVVQAAAEGSFTGRASAFS
jgi:hypothetical protein